MLPDHLADPSENQMTEEEVDFPQKSFHHPILHPEKIGLVWNSYRKSMQDDSIDSIVDIPWTRKSRCLFPEEFVDSSQASEIRVADFPDRPKVANRLKYPY